MLKKFSEKIGFTQTEIKVTLLLLVVFAAGFTYKTFIRDTGLKSYKNFDYSKDDSTFFSSGNDTAGAENKDEILELNKKNVNKFPDKIIAAENSIDLNTADVNALVTIPYVGTKTATRIIELRTKLGGFKNINQLLKVKNISGKRLAKIKKYAYIK
jgi:competence protein ComEA